MPTESYYLPCECGVRAVVDASQSGRELTCQCGRRLEVPPLRQLRSLAKVDTSASGGRTRRQTSAWNPARGIALVALVPLLGALAFGAYTYLESPEPPPPYASLEGHAPHEILFKVWYPLVERGIDDSFVPAVQRYIEDVNRRRATLRACGVVAGLSALAVVAGLLWPKPRPLGALRA